MESTTDAYDYYRACLAGDAPALPEEPSPGYYRLRAWGGVWVPVVILADPPRAVRGEQAQAGGKFALVTWPLDEARQEWARFGTSAVEREAWVQAVKTGRWHDDGPPMGHNRPPLDLSLGLGRPPLERAKAVSEQALAWLEAAPIDQPTKALADQGAELLHMVSAIAGDCAAEAKAKAAPLVEALSELKAPYATASHALSETDHKLRTAVWGMMEKLDVGRVGGVQRAVYFKEFLEADVTDAIAVLGRFRSHPKVVKLAQTFAGQERQLGVPEHPGWELKSRRSMSL